jgi:hypothetical protein
MDSDYTVSEATEVANEVAQLYPSCVRQRAKSSEPWKVRLRVGWSQKRGTGQKAL